MFDLSYHKIHSNYPVRTSDAPGDRHETVAGIKWRIPPYSRIGCQMAQKTP